MTVEKLISLALCSLGLFKSIQPHWLYFDQYVYTKYPNVTSDELLQEIIPARDYSALILVPFIIAGTDYLKYKPIIILQGFFSVILCSLLIWHKKVLSLIVSQVFRGFILSTDVAFYAYIFAIVTTENYKLNVCMTQASVLFGKFLGLLLALLLVVLEITSNLDTINYITLAFSLVSLIVTILLPHVKPRIPTQREIIERELRTPKRLKSSSLVREKMDKFVKDIQKVYSEITVILWSIWMVISGCCYFILEDKFSELLDEATPGRPDALSYDAGTVTLATVLGIIPILVYGLIKGTCNIYSEPVLLVLSLLQCILVLLLSTSHNIWLIYTTYTLSYIVYQLGFVLAIFLIGNILQARRYGFVFGINLLVSMVVKLVLGVIIGNHALNLPPSSQVGILVS
ncbi:hypothetical protein LOTGIDRAFT_114240 [Lottia gigantea]|uniref:Major facilitator superfamily (MFS) profile domain-containing protein n=1 Tax=Lottia gigantea TaxID=225164 RepID=V4AV87_LOTGI|nr:hypothetical protein LOTGIDRAFT_114240 [Lottia gigantea]ESO98880.1 hypothetical protein LOTGIDRAFT_114240 [Lottia gigantea]